MDTHKYKALLKAVELGSISAAAQELGYSPSGLNRLFDSLEKELGFIVLVRTPQGVGLTQEGRELLPKIRENLYWQDQIEEYCAAVQGLTKGELNVGSYYSLASCWLPIILRQFQNDYPGIHIHVKEGGNKDLLEGILDRRLHCSLFNKPAAYTGDWIPLYDARLVVLVPENHPLAKKEKVDPQDLNGQPFIEPLPNQETNVAHFLIRHHVQPVIRFSTGDMYTCWSMVQAGLGISMDNEVSVTRWSGRVKVLPFTTGDTLHLGIGLPSLEEASPALKKFIEYVKAFVVKEYGDKMRGADDRR